MCAKAFEFHKEIYMSVLDAEARRALKTSDFALPKERAYPIHNLAHARDALSRVSQFGTPDEQQKVRAAVHKRYPELAGQEKPPMVHM